MQTLENGSLRMSERPVMKIYLTPLRFPEIESRLLDYIERLILSNKIQPEVIIEPFSGSDTISLGLLASNKVKTALINGINPFITSFWRSIFKYNGEVVSKIQKVNAILEKYKLLNQPKKEIELTKIG